MPDISQFHGTLVSIHVLGVVLFVIAHAVSAFVLLRINSERDPQRLQSLLDWSRRSLLVAIIGFLIWFLAGVVAGFSGNWWTSGRYWIWVSLAIAIAITGVMTPMGRLYFNRIRAAVGIDPKTGRIDVTAQVDPQAVDVAVRSGQPLVLATLGIGALVILFWLMIAKPF